MDKKWVAGFGTSSTFIYAKDCRYIKDKTFRYVVYPTMSAEAVRIRFSNYLNDEKTVISKVSVAKTSTEFSENVIKDTVVPVTFGGRRELVMEAGQKDAVSDEIAFTVNPGEKFSVSLYFKEMTFLRTGHANSGRYIEKSALDGDYADEAEFPLELLEDAPPYAFFYGVDFLTEAKNSAIVAFGDSITAQPWPDCLAHRLADLGITDRSVIRRGISGNRVLGEYTAVLKRHYGKTGVDRFEDDVTTVAGADRVFVLHGINDMYHPRENDRYYCSVRLPSADEIIAGLKKYVEIAHRHGLKIYIATILPCKKLSTLSGDRPAIRRAVNEWIINNKDADGYIDFSAAVASKEDPEAIELIYDRGDTLHPSFEGAEQLANSIPEEFLR
ncbi:MAG: hypothetical protein J5894_02640 [Clostridia bacterium]|nr:hypothetical protein [Clostridia bacterium]